MFGLKLDQDHNAGIAQYPRKVYVKYTNYLLLIETSFIVKCITLML